MIIIDLEECDGNCCSFFEYYRENENKVHKLAVKHNLV